MFCDIKSEYCLDFINLFGLVLVTKSEGEIAGTRPSTTLNINDKSNPIIKKKEKKGNQHKTS
jgi:hypothetical protein